PPIDALQTFDALQLVERKTCKNYSAPKAHKIVSRVDRRGGLL
ncbi:MAG: hypothetical protein QOF09_5210, partial [Alphaproteobacteria bacterium]|nr:hypothetical protein [Alphaproteobacteria bacterium]